MSTPSSPTPPTRILHAPHLLPLQSPSPSTPLNIPLSPSQYAALYTGFSPTSMDDRWIISSSDTTDPSSGKVNGMIVYLHRSWTSSEILEIYVEKAEEGGKEWKGDVKVNGEGAGKGDEKGKGGRITGIKWETSEEIVGGGQNEKDAKETLRGVCMAYLEVSLDDEK